MRAQRSRRDALPLTWETPTAVTSLWILLALLAMPGGQGLACAATGRGVVWPQHELTESLVGLMAGRPGRGLRTAEASALPSDVVVYVAIAMLEVGLVTLTLWGLAIWWRSTGPGQQFGMASKRDVERTLGMSNLRARRQTLRPDLVESKSLEERHRQ
jgi:hypothetical protein